MPLNRSALEADPFYLNRLSGPVSRTDELTITMKETIDMENIDRRSLLRIMGWGSFFVSLVLSIAGSIRFMFPRVLFEEPHVFSIGYPEEFSAGGGPESACRVFEKWKDDHSVWIVKEYDRIYAMHSRCTHLGCTPNWYAEEGIFKCPCHGSRFRSNGDNYAGPAPRPLDRFHIFTGDDGNILVDKSKVYSPEEQENPGAYLKL